MRSKRDKFPLRMLALITQLGISMMVPIFMCGWIGSFLSDKAGKPFLIVIFLIIGILAGFKSCYVLIRRTVDLGGKKKDELK